MSDKRSLRIVHCFRAPVGGIFRHVRDLIEAQVKAGHRVGVVCDASTGGDFEEALLAEMESKLTLGLKRLPMQRRIGLRDIVTAVRTYQTIKQMRPDVLHGHGAKGGAYARMFGSIVRMRGIRVARFYSPHGGSLHYDPATTAGRVIFQIERIMERMTDRIIFVSKFEQDTYKRKIGEPRCQSTLIYNGLADSDFDPVVPGEGAADFLFIGELRDLKGPDIFIDALKKASNAGGRILTGIMVGDGKERSALIAQAEALGISEHIRFLMPMKAREAFRLANIVVIPSRAEALPYIVLEALAAGRPVITTRVGGIPEILGETSPALVQPEANQLCERMIAVLSAPSTFKEALPDVDILRQKFSIETMAAKLEAEYFAALNKPA
ncbi:glycosyltransferase family 4 protein [Phyllobacterium sp. 628]|uniref:glycosyltransferase family 4 protein n=1 Tax=Phyllobacterium sp. 628 TaxID=2718938 RepID=UPI0016625B3C|nr:glycosyltransferase family 4 protein [Phyllobacterium sp. 628]QND52650.1 glycosyltransferase family 4 protein [Phyllobacterium sp. 628]